MATKQKLIVEVVDARNLLPKDGHGSSSPYVVIDFYGQRKRTKSAIRDLNPTWNETLEFNVGKPSNVFGDMLELDVYHDKNYGPTRRINHLGRIRLSSSQFVRKGEEALIYYPLEKKYLFSWTQGEIGLRIYYQDEVTPPPPQPAAAQEEEAKADTNQESSTPQPTAEAAAPAESEAIQPAEAQKSDVETGATTESNKEQPAEEAKSNEEPPAQAEAAAAPPPPPPSDNAPAPIQVDKPPESDVGPSPPPQGRPGGQNKEDPSPSSAAVNEPAQEDGDGIVLEPTFRNWGPAPPEIVAASTGSFPEIKVSGINAPQPIIRPVALTSNYTLEPQESISIERSAFDLVEKMHYLFVRVVKARYLPTSGNPVVRIEVSNSRVQSKPARKTLCFEWDQTFAFGRDAPDSTSIVEISVWDPHDPKSSEMAAAANFLGGICFDVTEIPLRDPPDSPLAPQWYRLEGGGAYRSDLMLATWVGTQADDSFPDAWKTDTAGNINSRAKVYLSPKLWYLRATVLEAQDIFPLMMLKETAVQVKAQLGFQVQKTKTSVSRNGTPSWNEDLLFVAAEPCSDQLIFTLENRQPKGPVTIGMVRIALSAIERRVDDRKVASRWFSLEDPRSEKAGYRGRVQLRLCFDGGYHVMDEAAHMSSDYRPTARQLWKQPVGTFELGIIGCKNLSPMKTVDGKGCTDAYCVAKYGPKWVRTRTVCDSLDPKWNEQYTWKVYDPCTVLTIGVFDSSGVYEIDGDKTATRPDFRMGKVRVRLSTLETGKVYRNRYPLILLTNNGVKKMGEIEVAVKFVRATPTLDFLHVYTQPLLPLMHHLKPLGVVQQELLRNSAVKIIATHLSRSEPSLRREVVSYMLDVDTHAFSMRKIRANWIRIINVIASVIDIVRWIDDTRVWKNPTSTILVHALLIMLVWFPDLIIPTLAFYVFVIGAWNYRFRSRAPLPHFDPKLSLADTADRDELDEEFDPLPSSRPPEMVRTRYDKLRMLGGRVQTVLGDFATQGERLQALVTWRDPRATGIFVGLCFVVAMILYMVPSKMVAMASGFYVFRHPIFRDRMPSPALNFFRRLPSLSDRIMEPELVKRIGAATALEVRATGIPYVFAPCIAVCRDPRWGRCYESYSEDPKLVQAMTEIVPGLQGDIPANSSKGVPFVAGKTKVAACAKHYLGDGGTTDGINENNTQISRHGLLSTHMPGYYNSIIKGVSTIMVSYSSWNGVKMHANRDMVTGFLKNILRFRGFVISDWEGIDRITSPPHANYSYSIQAGISAGIDMIMVPNNYKEFIDGLTSHVKNKVIPMSRIDDAVKRILRVKFVMGLFENPLADKSLVNELGSQEHRELAREAVRKSLVLLKNGESADEPLLPLHKKASKILVAGSHADNLGYQCGGWTIEWQGLSGKNLTSGTTILTAIENTVDPSTEVVYKENPDADFVKSNNFSYAIVVVGEPPYAETFGDSLNLTISEPGPSTIQNVCGSVKCVTVIISGRPVVIQPYVSLMDALVAAWLPGTEGQGVADVLFGDYGFTGKLPRTWFKTVDQLPMNVGDRHYDALFPLGYGLTTDPTKTI